MKPNAKWNAKSPPLRMVLQFQYNFKQAFTTQTERVDARLAKQENQMAVFQQTMDQMFTFMQNNAQAQPAPTQPQQPQWGNNGWSQED